MSDPPRDRSSTIKQPPSRLALPASPRSPDFPAATARPRPASPTPTPTHPPTPTQHTARIRAHLAHLLPRHAAFTVSLTLHQLHNVPLVRGEFALKWKVKGVTSHSGTSILDRVKARKPTPRLCARTTPSLKSSDTDNASLFDAASDAHSVANSSSTHSPSNDHGSPNGHPARTKPVQIPAVVVSANHHSPQVARSSSIASASSASSLSSASPHLDGRFPSNPPGYLSAEWSRQATSAADTGALPKAPAKPHYTPANGITPFVHLKDHSVVWEKTLKFVVQMGVTRDNGELGDCLAKFIVMQRVIPGDPDAPRNPRLGAVYLNLAQYADAGAITRRHLLRQSKTNATLKLTIHVEHTAGEVTYVAPPLPKGEILSGVAGILESSDIYRTRPRASDLYTHASSDSSSDDVAAASGSDASSSLSGPDGQGQSQNHAHGHPDGHGRQTKAKHHRRPFEISKLPMINDPRGTEKLIEALFNPVPVTQPAKVTPFTYLVEVDGEGDGDGDGEDGERGSYRADRAAAVQDDGGTRHGNTVTVAGDAEDDGSLYTDSQDESADGGDVTEYHSLRSNPSFHSSLRSKCSTRSLASKVRLARDITTEATTSTGVQRPGGTTERRTWWQKVLSSPSAG